MASSASPLQRSIDLAGANQLQAIDVNAIFKQWSPDDCPKPLLVYLAWALNVDFWDSEYPEQTKREIIRTAPEQHAQRGTPLSVIRFLNIFNIIDFELIEDMREGNVPPGVILKINRPISNLTARLVFSDIGRFLRGASYISRIDFTSAPHSYNGVIRYDGEFNYGEVSND